MHKLNVKKVSLILIPVVCLFLIPCLLIYKSVSSQRILLKDQAKSERILLHNAKGGHLCHCFPPMIANNPGFQISNITATSASFRWVCDVEATYQVNYGTTTAKGTLFPAEKPTTYYKDYTVTVTGLKPNTVYYAGPWSQARGRSDYKKWLMSNGSEKNIPSWEFKTLPSDVATLSIKGSIVDNTGKGMSGVTVKLTGDTSITVTTTSTGVYEFTGLKSGKNYTVTPTKTDYTFTPPSISFTPLTADKTDQKFVGDLVVSIKVVRSGMSEQSFIIYEVVAKMNTASDATITWKTNLPSTSEVEYGTTKAYGLKSGENSELVTDHYIQLFGLKLGTTYFFKVVSKTAEGKNAVYSENCIFTNPTFEKKIANRENYFIDPNPCADRVEFNYYLYQPVNNLTIDLLTLSGKTVAELEGPSSALVAGWNRISWDIKDRSGKRLPNGLYVYKMRFMKGDMEEMLKGQLMVRR